MKFDSANESVLPWESTDKISCSPMDYENRETERAWLFPTISRSALSMEKGKEKSPSCKSRLSGAPKKIPYKKLLNHSAAGAAGVPSGVFVVGKMAGIRYQICCILESKRAQRIKGFLRLTGLSPRRF